MLPSEIAGSPQAIALCKEMDDEEAEAHPGLINPMGNFRLRWDIVMLVLILYNVWVVPYRICFEVEATQGWFMVELIFDIIFLADIVVNFFTGRVIETGVDWDRGSIAKNYLKGWFLIDFPSSIPLDAIINGCRILHLDTANPPGCYGMDSEGGNLAALKALKFLRMFRFMKLIRLLKAAKILNYLEEELDINLSILKLFKLLFIVMFQGHLIACMVYLITNFQTPTTRGMLRPDDWYECDESSCTYLIPPGDRYAYTLYWTMTTMTTIGYGDIHPITVLEAEVTIVVQLIGASIFGYMIGNIAAVLADFNQFGSAYKNQMYQIKAYLNYKKVPKGMQRRIRKYCAHFYTKKGVVRQDWEILPPRMRLEVLRFENSEFTTMFPSLWDAGDELVEVLVDRLRPYRVLQHELIGEPDDASVVGLVEFYLVSSGEVVIFDSVEKPEVRDRQRARRKSLERSMTSTLKGLLTLATNTERVRALVGEGYWFGHDELLLANEKSRDPCWMHSYRAKTACDLLFLVPADFFELVDQYPQLPTILGQPPRSSRALRRQSTEEHTARLLAATRAAEASLSPKTPLAPVRSATPAGRASLPSTPPNAKPAAPADAPRGSASERFACQRAVFAERFAMLGKHRAGEPPAGASETAQPPAPADLEVVAVAAASATSAESTHTPSYRKSFSADDESRRLERQSSGGRLQRATTSPCGGGGRGVGGAPSRAVGIGARAAAGGGAKPAGGFGSGMTSSCSQRQGQSRKLQMMMRQAMQQNQIDTEKKTGDAGLFKQRLQCLLGESLCSPDEIDEDDLFQKLRYRMEIPANSSNPVSNPGTPPMGPTAPPSSPAANGAAQYRCRAATCTANSEDMAQLHLEASSDEAVDAPVVCQRSISEIAPPGPIEPMLSI